MYTLLIRNVTAVDPAGEATHVLPGHDLAITGSRIVAVQPTGQIGTDEASEVIDGPHAPYTCSPEFLRQTAHEARALGLGCHIHVSESAKQVEASIKDHGVTPIRFLQQLGLMDGRLLCAHATHATPDDIELLASSCAGVAHCPKTFLKLASGIAPVTAMRAAGVPVGLGSDGAASNNTLDILEQMRLAAMLQKHERADARALPLGDALAMATSEGARALGQERELGRLAPGYLADVILVRLDGAHIQPVHDVAAALVYAARAGDVDTTIVDGRVLMRERKLLTLDRGGILREVAGSVFPACTYPGGAAPPSVHRAARTLNPRWRSP